jgi:twitching motility protein PilT
MDKKIPQEETATVSTEVVPPTGDGFDPLPPDLPKFKESLDQIMPEPSKPKPKEVKNDEKEKAKVAQSAQTQQPPERAPLRPENVQTQQKIPDQEQLSSQVQSNINVPQETLEPGGELTMQKLFSEAINRNASDLHLSVGYPPILRIDGELTDLDEKLLGPEDVERLIFSVLSDERKELLEVNREIDFAYTYEGALNARFRVNAYYTMRNLSGAFRLIPSRIKTIEELKLPQIYNQFAKLRQGLILVTGPTGHGKSTTIAAILEAINRTRFCHILTIEDPIEYVFEGKKALIDQREMNDDTHSWNIALRSALRQDPDVILVGEMRDFETIASAITLAETGHLVFATLHTNSASQTLDRIIDVFPENQQQQVRTQIAHTLEAVIAQRLIPLDKGGRRAVSEIMLNNSAVSNLIREGKMHQVDNVIRTSSDVGMVYLERSLVDLVREGVISVQRAQEYAVHPEEVLRLLKA